MKSSAEPCQKHWILGKAALIKPVLEGETALIKSVLEGHHSKEGLTLELQVQTLGQLLWDESLQPLCHVQPPTLPRYSKLQSKQGKLLWLLISLSATCLCKHPNPELPLPFSSLLSALSDLPGTRLASSEGWSTGAWEDNIPPCLPDLQQLLVEIAKYKIPA